MKKIFFFFSLFVLLWLVSACPSYDPPTNEMTINNHSDSAVYIYTSCKDFLESDKE